MMSTPQGPARPGHVSLDDVHVLRDKAMVTQTSHRQHPESCPINDRFAELIQSRPQGPR